MTFHRQIAQIRTVSSPWQGNGNELNCNEHEANQALVLR